jgi:hypothetical protein
MTRDFSEQDPAEILADLRMLVGEAEALSGPSSPRFLELAAAMAAALYLYGGNLGQIREGRDWARRAWAGSCDALGAEHPDTLARLQLLARLLGVFPENASECLVRWKFLIKALERLHGESHPTTLRAVDFYADRLESFLDYDRALPLRRRLLEASPSNARETVRVRSALVRTLTCLGHHEEALRLLQERADQARVVGGGAEMSAGCRIANYRAHSGRETLNARVFQLLHCLGGMERNIANCPSGLLRAADVISGEFVKSGFLVIRQELAGYRIPCANIEAVGPDFVGNDTCHYLVGTHYNSEPGTCGADDISGVVVLLEAARLVAENPAANRLRFVVFTNEAGTQGTGSQIHARLCGERADAIAGVICLDSVGYFSDEPGTQQLVFPPECLPDAALTAMRERGIDPGTGNFLAMLGDSRELIREFDAAFDHSSEIPVAPLELPDLLVSDHHHYRNECFPTVLLTDTSYLRNPHYARPTDTIDTLRWGHLVVQSERLARALVRMVESHPLMSGTPSIAPSQTQTTKPL